jgi:imidazolonepropionase-like amidohydrolase
LRKTHGRVGKPRRGLSFFTIRFATIFPGLLSTLLASAMGQPNSQPNAAPQKRIVIAASTLLDGRGSKIIAIDPNLAPVDNDLRGLTVLPGWIDSHVHIAWTFGKDGKSGSPGGTPAEVAYQVASNAWVTLLAGFTTVQSVVRRRMFRCRMRLQKASFLVHGF